MTIVYALEALGPLPPLSENDELGRMAARTLLDSVGKDEGTGPFASSILVARLNNARSCLCRAEQKGRAQGQQEGRDHLAKHIRDVLKL